VEEGDGEEYQVLMSNATWHLVPCREASNIVDCRWVHKVKKKPDRSVEWYKARLVAKGFKQQYGIDYEVPLARLSSLLLFALSCHLLWPIAGVFGSSMLRMPSCTAFLKKMFLCGNHLAMRT
jgi:hypothetical protein